MVLLRHGVVGVGVGVVLSPPSPQSQEGHKMRCKAGMAGIAVEITHPGNHCRELVQL